MSNKLYLVISGGIFFLVGIFHLLRLVYHWPILVGTRTVPHALSYVGFPVSTAYSVWAYCLWRSARRPRAAVPRERVSGEKATSR